MQNILNLISIMIVSFGGTGVIILVISSWIGKILLNKFEEKYEKKLETYKSEINAKLNKLDKIEEKALYITKV